MSEVNELVDWQYDDTLLSQIRQMDRQQRCWATYLALRRLQAPLTEIPLPEDWGLDPSVLHSLLREGAAQLNGEVNEGLENALAAVRRAPLFDQEIEPEVVEEFQLEALGGWFLLGESLGDLDEDQVDRILVMVRHLANYLDEYMDSSLAVVDGGDDRTRYLQLASPDLVAYRLGYFGTRNIEVEHICSESILSGLSGSGASAGSSLSQLEIECERFSQELLGGLRNFLSA